MTSLLKLLTLPAIFLVPQATLWGQEIVVPAGTIMQCTLEDANLSSKTVAPDDPILCDTGTLREFGVSVFPRGAYLQGRFAEARDPGHLWGKGWMQLEFDHIISPSAELPISTKITSVSHLKVDVEGRIHGTGHARRDAIEWSIPVLWPEKLVTLPNRGPRPVLKHEARITLKLMQDLAVPQEVVGREARPLVLPSAFRRSPAISVPQEVARLEARPLVLPGVFRPSTAMTDPMVRQASMVSTSGQDRASAEGTFLILKDGSSKFVKDYWFDSGRTIQFLSVAGKTGIFPIEALDFDTTVKVNRERGVAFVMRFKEEVQ
ncbi:hypothetical protein [Edaphobacter bradus]|uniref:hypothetical protein n=1 Tax=Edaphobacter bradus TaxID=2259016 RepID=UPI0021E0BDE2|nr:hypothetical protein [Edaphobacter bradus]